MFCLSCGKKIAVGSKFCKYCGEKQTKKQKINKTKYETVWTCDFCDKEFKTKPESDKHELRCFQNPKNKKFPFNRSPKKAWIFFWLITVLVFITSCFISAKFVNLNIFLLSRELLLIIFLANIFIGIIAFFGIAFSRFNPKNNEISKFTKHISLICLFYLIINPSVFAIEGYRAKQNEEYKNKYYTNKNNSPAQAPNPIPTLVPTIKPKAKVSTNTNTNTTGSQIECIGPDGKHFNTSMAECKNLAEKWGKPVDYMTNCNYPAECGGGTKREPYSECQKPCTRISTGSNNTQTNNNSSTNNSNKTAVFLSYGGYTVYCPAQNVGAVQSINTTMEAKKTEWATNYNNCTDIFFDTDSCFVACVNTEKSKLNQCDSLSDSYKSCSDAALDFYAECIKTCPSASDHCDYVYWERKNLSSQITNLCK